MKKCELCESAARVYCGSDQASLCWDCDSMVHSANFIVSKHTRTLLCHSCQSPTPWTGSGSKLDPTVSVCESCFTHDLANPSSTSDDSDGSHEHHDDDDDHTENQVVPLSLSPSLAGNSSNSADTFSDRDCSLLPA
ncbi:zinc finger protein CONSTANS-LIKE 7-like [Primulina huaijiensis]|uniref:zinc finger protein CONSTANS-LIKE 7-like n=1 Tax=Primulina huaijiensis TaxID=1492673 RepID=UPI003CC6EDB7